MPASFINAAVLQHSIVLCAGRIVGAPALIPAMLIFAAGSSCSAEAALPHLKGVSSILQEAAVEEPAPEPRLLLEPGEAVHFQVVRASRHNLFPLHSECIHLFDGMMMHPGAATECARSFHDTCDAAGQPAELQYNLTHAQLFCICHRIPHAISCR